MTPGETPFFSVIMNIYNGEAYLRAAIDSVLAQTHRDWELIFYDDCSTDGSAAICRSYTDPRIRYIRADQQVPVAAARGAAVVHARGTWIAFIDQDDIWLPHKLAGQAALAMADTTGKLGLVYGRTDSFEASGRQWPFDHWSGPRTLPEGDLFTLLLQRPSFINLSSVALRRCAVLALVPLPSHVYYCPDYYLFLEVTRHHRAACLQELCTLYRVHSQNMTHRFRGPIHAEIIDIINHAAGPEHAGIVRRRRTVHETWIAVDEIVSGRGRRRGLRRMLRHGSISYLAGRPLLSLGRRMVNEVSERRWKYRAIRQVRRLGLLSLADRVKLGLSRVSLHKRNARFRQAHPEFPVPPTELAFDAYNTIDWYAYRDGGLKQAEAFAQIIRDHAPERPLAVLEWGCGPGRLIRHMPALLAERARSVTGSDYNRQTIAWCRANLPGIQFIDNDLNPPIGMPDGSFDAIYCFSVLTHLSQPVQQAWVAELHRLLAPGGVLVCTTHGDNYRYLLVADEEQQRYAAGGMVEQAQYGEGRKWYFAIHPPSFVRGELLSAFATVDKVATAPDAGIQQDVWLARKSAG